MQNRKGRSAAMTKKELIDEMAQASGITKTQAGKALDSLLGAFKSAMKDKNAKIALSGLGTFAKVHRKARKGTNPATGEQITIKARNAIKFVPSKTLKDAVS
jgi:DNA-binding protein HU-beta